MSDPYTHWDGQRWLRWNGAAWVPLDQPTAPVPYQPGPPAQPTKPSNGLAIASLVLAVIGALLVLSVVVSPLATVFGIVAIVLGALGLRRARLLDGAGRGLALGGLITGVVVTIIGLIASVIFVVVWANYGTDIRRAFHCALNIDTDAPNYDELMDACMDRTYEP